MKTLTTTIATIALSATLAYAEDFNPTEIAGFTFESGSDSGWSQLEDSFGEAGWQYVTDDNFIVGGKNEYFYNSEGLKNKAGQSEEWFGRMKILMSVDLLKGATVEQAIALGCGITNTCGADPLVVGQALVNAGKAKRGYEITINPLTGDKDYTLVGMGGDSIVVGVDYIRLSPGAFKAQATPTAKEFKL